MNKNTGSKTNTETISLATESSFIKKHGKTFMSISVGFCLVSAVVGLASCAASINPSELGQKTQNEVKKGMTKDQVKAILGRPQGVTTYNGTENWHYQKNNILKAMVPYGLGGNETNVVIISFGPNGKVSNINNMSVSNRVS